MPSKQPHPSLELQDLSNMERIRRLWEAQHPYEPVDDYRDDTSILGSGSEDGSEEEDGAGAKPFSRIEYWIFLIMGIAMLWAWNMFLAAAPYFQHRFSSHKWILSHFQSAETSVSTVTNLGSMLALTKLQENASYPNRIALSLCINIICFTLLALSTLVATGAGIHFGFLMLMVFSASLATGLIQNGVFAYVAGFGRGEYTQAIMTGQAVAGVLPCLAQIAVVVAIPKTDGQSRDQANGESPKSAFAYFMTATAVSVISLFAFLYLLRRRSRSHQQSPNPSIQKSTANGTSESDALTDSPTEADSTDNNSSPLFHHSSSSRKPIGLISLFRKLPSLSTAIFLCFALTMIFPVFTTSIQSLQPDALPATLFIPLAFLVWNTGDLLGRLSTLWPALSLTHHPFALLCLSLARLIFVPLYLLCNVGGRGATVHSDLFYLAVVQLLFGLTNGYLGSSCMIGASEWVDQDEREVAGAYMGLCLVAGLTVGSLLSFCVGGI